MEAQPNILVVDESLTNRDALCHQLNGMGYQVYPAVSGLQALKMMQTQTFDLMLLQCRMQQMLGIEVLQQLNASGALANIAVVALSSLDGIQDVQKCIELGADDFLLEPVIPELLRLRVITSLHNNRLRRQQQDYQEREKFLKYEADVQVARRIQQNFLPEELPLPQGWDIAAYFSPARDVAGDFYDVFPLANGRRVGLVIADVCDKGVPAALFMALTRSLIRAYSSQNYSLRWVANDSDDWLAVSPGRGRRILPTTGTSALKNAMMLTNDYIVTNHSSTNMFATLFFGVLDPLTGRLTYVNGGHNPPIVISSGEIKAHLKTTGPAVGVIPSVDYAIAEIIMEPGDLLMAFTDGVTEAKDPSGQFFSEGRLISLLKQRFDSCGALLSQIESSLRAHISTANQFDDITMLTARRAAQ